MHDREARRDVLGRQGTRREPREQREQERVAGVGEHHPRGRQRDDDPGQDHRFPRSLSARRSVARPMRSKVPWKNASSRPQGSSMRCGARSRKSPSENVLPLPIGQARSHAGDVVSLHPEDQIRPRCVGGVHPVGGVVGEIDAEGEGDAARRVLGRAPLDGREPGRPHLEVGRARRQEPRCEGAPADVPVTDDEDPTDGRGVELGLPARAPPPLVQGVGAGPRRERDPSGAANPGRNPARRAVAIGRGYRHARIPAGSAQECSPCIVPIGRS